MILVDFMMVVWLMIVLLVVVIIITYIIIILLVVVVALVIYVGFCCMCFVHQALEFLCFTLMQNLKLHSCKIWGKR